MRVEIAEAAWLDDAGPLSIAELAERSGLARAELEVLIECEVLTPVPADDAGMMFGADCLAVACAARRLRSDFDLDAPGLALALRLLARVRELEAELQALQAQLPQRW